jgi:hypothetical protein
MITSDEIDGFVTDTQDALHNIQIKLLQERVAPLVGKTVKIERTLKDPVSGAKIQHELDATITGAQWSYDDGIDFTVNYIHPYTGKVMETTEGA